MLSVLETVLQAAARPAALVGGLDQLVTQLGQVATRALALLDVAEPLAGRIEELVTRAGTITDEATSATERAAETVGTIQPLVDQVGPLLQAAATVDPQALTALIETLPVVLDKLAAQVDHLDRTVADVGALLSGIPGASRLAKRGDRLGNNLTAR